MSGISRMHALRPPAHCTLAQVSFRETRDSLVSRPWAVDDLDGALQYFGNGAPRKAVMFCDNAGSDVILGAVFWFYVRSSFLYA